MNRLRVKLALLLGLGMGWHALDAAPAPWWQWRSKIDGQLICSQTPLGQGWERAYGPFRDARCEKPIVVR